MVTLCSDDARLRTSMRERLPVAAPCMRISGAGSAQLRLAHELIARDAVAAAPLWIHP